MTVGGADRDAALTSTDETYYVIGIQPDIASVMVARGSVHGTKFYPDVIVPGNFSGPPKDGYIVSRAHAGQTLAITFVSMRRPDALLASSFVPCGPARTLSFAVAAGKVIYLGDVTYTPTFGRLAPSYSQNFDAAKIYMSSHYPMLADKLEQGSPVFISAVPPGCPTGR